ncbi:MAG: sigma-70 family RNA polymerase sigma factor [Lachnospiraceae bacterium]|nr:sigma-70 family RNA polymerase sigma factor [Lachnospiraceae bacterium]
MRDEQIIELYWARDERAIEETDRAYGPYCSEIARRILEQREDVEETVNDTWLKTWEAIPPRCPRFLKLFLAKITRNLAFNRYEAQRAQKRGGGEVVLVLDELAECVSGSETVETQVEMAALEHLLSEFVRELPLKERNIFVRRYFFTETVVDIAKRYDMSRNTVANYLARTRQDLREQLQKEGYIL